MLLTKISIPCERKTAQNKNAVEDNALDALLKVPRPVRSLVIRQTEKHVKEMGDEAVTLKHFANLAQKYVSATAS